MIGLIVKSLNSECDFAAHNKVISIQTKEIWSLSSEIQQTNKRYQEALIDRNHLFRECVRMRTEITQLKAKLLKLKHKKMSKNNKER